jgi:type I restriction enzyme M protein
MAAGKRCPGSRKPAADEESSPSGTATRLRAHRPNRNAKPSRGPEEIQLYTSLWQSCDELRGGMDASHYKDYVLTLLFMKYVSDKLAASPNSLIEVPDGGSFADTVKLKGDKEIGDRINKIIARLAEVNDLMDVIDQADFNDEIMLGGGKEMQDRLSKLVAIFEGLDVRANRAEGDDLLGDAKEYLMRHFATESGKSKGQFYTPAEVSRILAEVVGIGPDTRPEQTICDPPCGPGSLLLKATDEAPRGISICGQEMDVATWARARMNMILHGHPTAEIKRQNTLSTPLFRNKDDSLKTFDHAVANPPFSTKAWASGLDPANDEFGRFAYGIPPANNGDCAFLLHLIKSLKSTGKGAGMGALFGGSRWHADDVGTSGVGMHRRRPTWGCFSWLLRGSSEPVCTPRVQMGSELPLHKQREVTRGSREAAPKRP